MTAIVSRNTSAGRAIRRSPTLVASGTATVALMGAGWLTIDHSGTMVALVLKIFLRYIVSNR